jgi:pSer/pThr/pTyr-binding forkhead associated (FHA) protein
MTTIAPLAPAERAITPTAPVVIGRHRDSDFVIGDSTVSRRHAALHREGYVWILEDLGSKNGTRLNGRPVEGRAVVAPGDEIGFGAATARFDPDERRLFSMLRVEQPVT